MNSKEFRKAGKDVIDWIADYYEKISEFPVQPSKESCHSTVG